MILVFVLNLSIAVEFVTIKLTRIKVSEIVIATVCLEASLTNNILQPWNFLIPNSVDVTRDKKIMYKNYQKNTAIYIMKL